jgi:hypothetical protein
MENNVGFLLAPYILDLDNKKAYNMKHQQKHVSKFSKPQQKPRPVKQPGKRHSGKIIFKAMTSLL